MRANLIEERACGMEERLVSLGSSGDWVDNWMNTLDKQVMRVEHQSMEDVLQACCIQVHQDTQQGSLNLPHQEIELF